MKKILIYLFGIIFLAILVEPLISQGRVYVRGYFRDNGTYVEPHYRTAPDGNVNPYTGEPGTKRHPDDRSYNFYESNYDDFDLAPVPAPRSFNLNKEPTQ